MIAGKTSVAHAHYSILHPSFPLLPFPSPPSSLPLLSSYIWQSGATVTSEISRSTVPAVAHAHCSMHFISCKSNGSHCSVTSIPATSVRFAYIHSHQKEERRRREKKREEGRRKERKGKERKGKERKGKERKGKERKGKERGRKREEK